MHETCSKCAHHQSPPLSPNPIVNKESTQTFQNVFDATSINFLTLDIEAFHLEVKMFLPSPAPEKLLEQLFLLGQVHKRWAIIHNGVVLCWQRKTKSMIHHRNRSSVSGLCYAHPHTTRWQLDMLQTSYRPRAANNPWVLAIIEKAPTRAFSWLKVALSHLNLRHN